MVRNAVSTLVSSVLVGFAGVDPVRGMVLVWFAVRVISGRIRVDLAKRVVDQLAAAMRRNSAWMGVVCANLVRGIRLVWFAAPIVGG